MSIKLAKSEIESFLSSAEPAVICISGKWGAGKTYAWKRYLKDFYASGNVSPNYTSYSYISLFGQNSLQEVKNSIFPSTIPLAVLEEGPNPEDFTKKAKAAIQSWRKIAPWVSKFLQEKTSIVGLEQLFLLAIKKQIICIDDLERRGEGLQIKDILGLASFLKEEKSCKVVIILNDEMLEDTDKQDFKGKLEKVVDIFIKFNPTPSEAADIGIDKGVPFYASFSADIIKLGILNIRVIKKIQRLASILKEKLSNYDTRIFENALHSLILLAWTFYQPSEAPPVEFIKEHSSYFPPKDKDSDKNEDKTRWTSILNTFGWTHFDEMDSLLLTSLKDGYFDDSSLQTIAQKLQKDLAQDDKSNSFSKAWDLYHATFDDNKEEVLDKLFDSFKQNVEIISPSNLDATVRFFKEFDRAEQAKEMVKFYIEKHPGDKEFYSLHSYSFREDVKDEDVVSAFEQKSKTFTDNRNPLEVLEGIIKNHGWNVEDIELLSKLTKEDFYKLFKDNKGDKLRIAIYGALEFTKVRGIGEKEKNISLTAIEALKQVASESDINRRRVTSYGVTLDEQTKSV